MISTLLLLAALVAPKEVVETRATVERVKDGDTIVVIAHWEPFDVHITLAIRVMGVDCPETKGGLQKARGLAAKEFTETWTATYPEVIIGCTGVRSFARYVCTVCPPGGGQCLAQALIAHGHEKIVPDE